MSPPLRQLDGNIATATGQECEPPAEASDGMRDGDTFAAAQDAPEGASPLVRLVAYIDRTL